MIKNNTKNRGFTLIELLLYFAIIPLVLLPISSFLSSFFEARVKNQTVMEVEEQGVSAMNIITQTIRNAEAINTPLLGSSASSLSLNVVDAGLDPTLFDLSGSTLRVTEGIGSPVALTNTRVTASGLTFQNLSRPGTPGVIRIQFTLSRVNPEARHEYNFTKTFYGSATIRQ